MPRNHLKVKRPSTTLDVDVWNFRIAWYAMIKLAYRMTLVALALTGLGLLGWGVKLGLQRALFDNPDFRLQIVDLNPNQAIDENDLVRITGLDLNSNLFRIDISAMTKRLASRPEIESVKIERHLPGTLVVRIVARTPLAWLACPDAGLSAERKPGALLVDRKDFAFPCSPRQFETAAGLPIFILPVREAEPVSSGAKLRHPQLAHCRRLLETVLETAPAAAPWIDTIRQANGWSLVLTTADGITATFGLGDHARQVGNLLVARTHAQRQGYAIATINLIPKVNVPITVSGGAEPPKALPVEEPLPTDPPRAIRVEEPSPATTRQDRQASDLKKILNRD